MTRAIDRLIVSGSIDSQRARPTRRRRSAGCSAGSTAPRSSQARGEAPVELEREGARVLVRARPHAACRASRSRVAEPSRRWSTTRRASSRSSRPAQRRRCRRSRRCSRRSRRCPSRRCTTCAGSPTARSRSSSAARTATTPSGSPACGPRTRTERSPGRAGWRRPRSATRCTGCSSSSTSTAPPPPDVEQVRAWYPAVTDEELARIAGFVASYCESELAQRIAALAGARPERPFAFEHDGVLLHGRLDVLHRDGSRALVLDYKTNTLAEGTPEEIVEADYRLQRLVYALACFRAGAEEVEVVYHFLERPDAVVSTHVRARRRAGARSGALGGDRRIRAGEFRPTPSEFICAGCPALDVVCAGPRLRSRPPELAAASAGTLMRVAALCDVHGNLPALEAVLAEVASLEVDRIVVRRRRRRGAVPARVPRPARRSRRGLRPRQRRPRVAARARGNLGVDRRAISTRCRVAFLRELPRGRVARRRPLLPRLAARRRRDPDPRLARRALSGGARRRRGAPRRRRAHARPVRPRRRRDPLRQRRQRRHAVRGQAGRVLGAGRRRRASSSGTRRTPSTRPRPRSGRAAIRARIRSRAGCSSRRIPDEVSAYFESIAT